MAKVKVGNYEYDSRSADEFVAPPGGPTVGAPAPKEPSMQARALAEILSQVRYEAASSGENEGDPSTIRPKFFANLNNVNTQRYGGDYMPSDRYDVEVRPEDNDGEYLYSLFDKLGPGVAEGFAVDGSDSNEDHMSRNLTKFMRGIHNYVPEDDLALALAEIYATEPGAAPGQTGSRTQTGQSDKAGSYGGANTLGATVGSTMAGVTNMAGMPMGSLGFGLGLYNSMKYGTPFGAGYPQMDRHGNAIPGTGPQFGGDPADQGGFHGTTGTIGGM